MPAPYHLPADLQRQTLGVSWKTLGQPGGTQPSAEENNAQLLEICYTATGLANDELNQDVRNGLVTEDLYFPSHWASLLPSYQVRMLMAFNPIVDVPWLAISAAAQAYPKNWTVAPLGAAWSERRPTGIYGVSSPSPVSGGANAILTTGAYFSPWLGRMGQQIAVMYSHGWPHAALVAAADSAASTLAVDEVCGFTGAACTISDGANTENVVVLSVTQPTPSAYNAGQVYFPGNQVTYGGTAYQCTLMNGPNTPSGAQTPAGGAYWATVIYPAGPGTLNLAAPTRNAHAVPVLVTAMPPGVRWGMALYAKRVALEKGLATVAAPGREGKAVSTGTAIEECTVNAVAALRPFARII